MTDLSPAARWLPTAHVRSCHERTVAASPEQTMRALEDLDLGQSLIARVLFALRGLPRDALKLSGVGSFGFATLERGEDEWVLGFIGQPWRLTGGIRHVPAAQFRDFCEPGYARVAWSFCVRDEGAGGTRLITETRVHCTDEVSRRRFRRYWWCIGPFSGLIRRLMLRMVAQQCHSNRAGPERSGVLACRQETRDNE